MQENCDKLQVFAVFFGNSHFFYYICRRYRARIWASARVINDVENNRKHLKSIQHEKDYTIIHCNFI